MISFRVLAHGDLDFAGSVRLLKLRQPRVSGIGLDSQVVLPQSGTADQRAGRVRTGGTTTSGIPAAIANRRCVRIADEQLCLDFSLG
jgi:hypothetical protein